MRSSTVSTFLVLYLVCCLVSTSDFEECTILILSHLNSHMTTGKVKVHRNIVCYVIISMNRIRTASSTSGKIALLLGNGNGRRKSSKSNAVPE